MAIYTQVADPAPPPPAPYYGIAINGVGTSQPFTVAQYASWRGVTVTVAHAILDAAVAAGILTVA